MIYGNDDTIHQTGHLDIEVTPDGEIDAVWFRCVMLPFKVSVIGADRAGKLKEAQEKGLPSIKAIELDLDNLEILSGTPRWVK